jgi:hypothetical protein
VPSDLVSCQEIRDWLNALGVEQARLLFNGGGLPPTWSTEITGWLAEEGRKQSQYRQNLETMRMRTQADVAQSAKRAARISAYAAIAATVFTLLTIIVTAIYR